MQRADLRLILFDLSLDLMRSPTKLSADGIRGQANLLLVQLTPPCDASTAEKEIAERYRMLALDPACKSGPLYRTKAIDTYHAITGEAQRTGSIGALALGTAW